MQSIISIPAHIAIIMDGNRRWAKIHRLPVYAGHRKVADEVIEQLVEHASHKGIQYITFWAWSTDNWKRKRHEINAIMKIFRHLLRDKWEHLHKKGVRIEIIGDILQFDEDIQRGLIDLIEKTKNNTAITAVFALNYGGRDEIIRAISKMLRDKKIGKKSKGVDAISFQNYLDTHAIPDPDMIVRTGGEKRLSGFLLWQSEYSELFFPEFYMPEFTVERLDELLEAYAMRKRRFGQ